MLILDSPEVPWGDYGDILLCGVTAHLSRQDGMLQLERTGPFIPPISFSGIRDIVVTDVCRALLEASGLTGFTFRPVIKRHIVHLEWERWDRTTEDPPEFPETGEPEDYILERPHSPEIAEGMGNLWEVVLGEHAVVERVPRGPGSTDNDIYVVQASWDGTDFFRASTVGYVYVSEQAKTWLEQVAAEWVSFRRPLIK